MNVKMIKPHATYLSSCRCIANFEFGTSPSEHLEEEPSLFESMPQDFGDPGALGIGDSGDEVSSLLTCSRLASFVNGVRVGSDTEEDFGGILILSEPFGAVDSIFGEFNFVDERFGALFGAS